MQAMGLQRLWPGQLKAMHTLHLLPSSHQLCLCGVNGRSRHVAQARKGTGSRPSQGSKPPPPLAEAPPLDSSGSPTPEPLPNKLSPSLSTPAASPAPSSEENGLALKVLWRRLLIDLSSLPRAIALMAATFAFSALGTFIPQNKAFEYYIQNYPEEGDKVLGFLTYNIIFLFDLDHIYNAWYFYLTLGWLAASLMACTTTRQWPAVKVAQRWRFQSTPVSVAKQGTEGRGIAEVLPGARLPDLGLQLANRGYQVFVKGPSLYAFKGLAGKLGPIGVHAALLLTLAGTSYSGFGGYKGTVMMPEGEEFLVSDVLRAVSPVAITPSGASKVLHVNKFSIDYRPDGSVAQFYSDLSLFDPTQPPSEEQLARAAGSGTSSSTSGTSGSSGEQLAGRELLRKTISVNDPFRFGGLTMYQTDWSLSAVKIRVLGGTDSPMPTPPSTTLDPSSSTSTLDSHSDGPSATTTTTSGSSQSAGGASGTSTSGGSTTGSSTTGTSTTGSSSRDDGNLLQLPMASLEGKPGINGRLWGSYLPVAAPSEMEAAEGKAPRGISILARDPQSVIFYDTKGQFVGVRRPGSGKPIDVEGVRLVAEGVVGATGLEIKSDPGVPFVYAGFGGLMVTTLVSYLSHSQVWALQEGATVYVAGRSNRARIAFDKEMSELLDQVPEVAVPEEATVA